MSRALVSPRNAGMLRATAFRLAEHGLAGLSDDSPAPDGERGVRAVFEEFLAPRTGPLIDRLGEGLAMEPAFTGFAEAGQEGDRLLAPFLQAAIEARGLFGDRRLLEPVVAGMRREAGIAAAAPVQEGEAEVAVALLADFALLAGPTRVFLPETGGDRAPAFRTALRLVVAGAASALRGLHDARRRGPAEAAAPPAA